jgi:hypothetical protein
MICYWNCKPLIISKSGVLTQYFHNPVWKRIKNKQLHDIVQKYSSGEISREQYTRALGFKYQARTESWDYHLIFMYIFALNF